MKRKFLFTALFTMAISTISTAFADTASFYANSLEGQLMKNGKPYNASAYTAASTKYPLNTLLKVSYKKKSVIVRVTDTGRFHKKHLDLSRSAFRHLEKDLGKGIIDVKVEEI